MESLFAGFAFGGLLHMVEGWFISFGTWIAGIALVVLGFLFSPTIRLYTIAVIAVLAVGFSIYFYGFTKGQISVDVCGDFFKMVGQKKDTAVTLKELAQHNAIGAKLRCW